MGEEKWIKIAKMQQFNKLEKNLEIYFPVEELLKEHKIKYKYEIEEELNDNKISVKSVNKVYSVNLYVEESNVIKANQIIDDYEKADVIAEELTDAEDEVVQKTIPAIILPYIYVVLFGIIVVAISFASFENVIPKIIGGVIGSIIIIYAIKSVIQKILERKKEK